MPGVGARGRRALVFAARSLVDRRPRLLGGGDLLLDGGPAACAIISPPMANWLAEVAGSTWPPPLHSPGDPCNRLLLAHDQRAADRAGPHHRSRHSLEPVINNPP